MVNLKTVQIGNGLYLSGFLGALLSGWIVPAFFDAIANAFIGWTEIPSDYIQGIGWIGLIIIWILSTIALPTFISIQGLLEEGVENKGFLGKFTTTSLGVLWFLFSILIFYALERYLHVFTTLAGVIPTDLTILTVLYWMQVVCLIIMNIIVIPYFLIYKSHE